MNTNKPAFKRCLKVMLTSHFDILKVTEMTAISYRISFISLFMF
ncbi:hypothetical protein FM109_07990 [Vibrio casei]|nr:hypothetical protein FM109_07990 [Vibrio casei]